jgi:hypothetical protein
VLRYEEKMPVSAQTPKALLRYDEKKKQANAPGAASFDEDECFQFNSKLLSAIFCLTFAISRSPSWSPG